MVGLGIAVREVEHLGEDLKDKFRSERMKGGRKDREVISLIMKLKLGDERRHQRELRLRRDNARGELESACDGKCEFRQKISVINREATNWRQVERKKYKKKVEHLLRIREEEE